jgi:O-antigen/teichoic acid export membrane protein
MNAEIDSPVLVSDRTAELRANRNRRSANSTVAAMAARVITLGASFVAIPLTIGYLGVERYGIFVALTSLMSMLVFADLGLGNGLLNLVSDANGRDDREAAAGAVSSAFFMLLAVAAAIGLIAVVVLSLVPWASFLHVRDSTIGADVTPTLAVLNVSFLIGLPLGTVERVRLAFQEGYVTSAIAIAAGIAGLGALVLAIQLRVGLPVLVAAISAPPLVALGVNAYLLFAKRRPWIMPVLRRADRVVAWRLARLGFLFLVLQLAVAVAYQSDVVVAGVVIGPAAAATYAVTLKFFFLVPSFVGIFLVTLWPAYTEALARNDLEWVRRTLLRSAGIAFLASSVASITLLLVGGWVIRTWTGGAINPPLELLIGAALWATVSATFNAMAMLLNAASIVLFQVAVAAIMAGVSIVLSVLLANAVGVSGIIWGTLIAYIACSAIPTLVLIRRFIGGRQTVPYARS